MQTALPSHAALRDQSPNANRFNVTTCLGGDNPLRLADSWGVGYLQNSVSDVRAIRANKVKDERGVEAYYNAGITPWCHISADVQYIDVGLPNANNSLILGLRTKMDF